jgi:Rrf2 family iron-sulfur cluster assembly transcriptional regulator
MIDLALRDSAAPVPLQDLAVRHHISLSYLEQVFAKLRQHGLVESTRGPGGGYTLAQKSSRISVADIISAIESDAQEGAVRRHNSASAEDMTQELWDSLHTAVLNHMKTITLQGLAEEQRAKGFQVEERKPAKKGVFQKLKLEPLRMGVGVPNSVFALARAVPSR